MVFAIHWRAAAAFLALIRTGIALSLIALALGLSACGQAPPPTGQGPQAGLETVLRSDNAQLIAETVLQVMDLPGYAPTTVKTLLDRIRETPAGRASIDHAAGVLVAELEATPAEPTAEELTSGPAEPQLAFRMHGAVLTALAALEPDGRGQARFLPEFRKLIAGQSSLLESVADRPAIGLAALLVEGRAEQRGDFIARANERIRAHLLFAAARLRVPVPVATLRQAVSRILGEAGQTPDGLSRLPQITTLGFALRLLDTAGASPTEPADATMALARARAALSLGEADRAMAALRAAANAPPTATSTAEWLETVMSVVDEYPARQPELRALAERLVPANRAYVHFFELARLGSTRDAAEAERILRTRPQTLSQEGDPTETGVETPPADFDTALIYLDHAGRAGRGIAALCDSPWGRSTAASSSSPPEAWTGIVAALPAAEAASLVRDRLVRDPGRAESICIAAVAALQETVGKSEAVEAVIAVHGQRPASDPAVTSLTASVQRTSAACLGTAAAAARPSALARIESRRLLDFALHCPVDSGLEVLRYQSPNRLTVLLHSPLRRQFLSLWAPRAIASPVRLDSDPFAIGDRVFAALLEDSAAPRELDYSALVAQFLADTNPRGGLRDMTGSAARLILVAGNEAGIATWLVAKLNNYGRAAPDDALAGTLSTFRRAWRDTARTERAVADAQRRLGLDSPQAARQRVEGRRAAYARLGQEAAQAVQQLCSGSGGGDGPSVANLASAGQSCSGAATGEASAFANDLRGAGFTAAADAIDGEAGRDRARGTIRWTFLTIGTHAFVWALLLLFYPISPTVQASVFWNPWIRKYLGLGYVQLLLLIVPPFTRRLLAPFRDGFVRDGQLDGFRPEIYYDDIRGIRPRPEGPEEGRLAELIPAIDGKIWLEARSGSGKSWFLRNLALRIRRPLIFLNATSCAGGVTAAIKARMQGWLAESDFLEQLIYTGRIVIIVDGLNEVAAATRSDIVAYADRFPRARILIATQNVQTAPPAGARRVEVQPLGRAQIEGFLLGRADEVLAPGEDRGPFTQRVAAFLDSLERGTPKEREELLAFVSNPMDLRLAAALLARDIEPDLLNLQKQQIELVERDYLAANGNPFPIVAFAEALYALRCADKSLMLGEKDWPAEREALRAQRLVLRADGPDGTTLWRFRHDKIADYFLYVAFRSNPARQAEHIADNRFIGVYVLIARDLPDDLAMELLQEISWAGGEKDDFTLTRAFQEALTQKLALQRGTAARRAAGKARKAGSKRSPARPPAGSPPTG